MFQEAVPHSNVCALSPKASNTADNVSVIFIAFKNFEKKMKDPDFEYETFAKTQCIKDKYDFSLKNNTK